MITLLFIMVLFLGQSNVLWSSGGVAEEHDQSYEYWASKYYLLSDKERNKLDQFLSKRWKVMCAGAARYAAMAEAYDLGKPDPCQRGNEK
jgi:hypothetical protein